MRITLVAAISSVALLFSGCAELPSPAPTSTVDFKVCAVTDKLSVDSDLSQVVDYSVKQAVVTYGIHSAAKEATKTNLAKTVAKLSKTGCNLFVIQGDEFDAAIAQIAKNQLGQNFIFISNRSDSAAISLDQQNLVSYTVDEFEQGLVLGYFAAAIANGNSFALGCLPVSNQIFDGIQSGVSRFAKDSGQIANLVLQDTMTPPSLEILAECKGKFDWVTNEVTGTKTILVGNGLDLYLNPVFKDLKGQIAGSVTPAIGSKIMEAIASSLEGDFIGGRLGSYSATYGNGGIKMSSERDTNYPKTILAEQNRVTLDYETR